MVPEPVAVEAEEAPLFEPAAPAYSDQPVFKCDTCGKEFASRRSISSHMRLHIGRVRVRCKLVCELCGKQFNHRNNLAAHAPVCSGKYKLHCGTCGKGFSLRTKLKASILVLTTERLKFIPNYFSRCTKQLTRANFHYGVTFATRVFLK
jgi:hypothetical protein